MNSPHLKEFNNLLKELSYSQNYFETFRDFVEMVHISLANTVYRGTDQGEEMEKRYLSVAGKYSKEQLEKFSKMLAQTILALTERPHDFLGEAFMGNDMGNAYRGQFFTPYHISSLMAQINIGSVKSIVEQKGFFNMMEPTCGSGGMVIAVGEIVRKEGFDPETTFWAQAQDIDPLCFKMAYIQLSVMGIPARVVLGNTLMLQEDEVLYTPAFIKNDWFKRIEDANAVPMTPANTPIWDEEQLEVFKTGTLF